MQTVNLDERSRRRSVGPVGIFVSNYQVPPSYFVAAAATPANVPLTTRPIARTLGAGLMDFWINQVAADGALRVGIRNQGIGGIDVANAIPHSVR